MNKIEFKNKLFKEALAYVKKNHPDMIIYKEEFDAYFESISTASYVDSDDAEYPFLGILSKGYSFKIMTDEELYGNDDGIIYNGDDKADDSTGLTLIISSTLNKDMDVVIEVELEYKE